MRFLSSIHVHCVPAGTFGFIAEAKMGNRKEIKDSQVIELYNELKNCCKVARILNCSNILVRYRLLKHGFVLSSYKVGSMSEERKKKISDSCKGRQGWNKGIPASEETKRKMSQAMKGKTSPMKNRNHTAETRQKFSNVFSRGGKKYSGRCGEFWRKIARQKFKSLLKNDGGDNIVHHIDGNITNNNLSNLRLMSRSEHTILHHKQGDIH